MIPGDNHIFPFERCQEEGDLHSPHSESCSQTKEGASVSEQDLGRELKVSRDGDGSSLLGHGSEKQFFRALSKCPAITPGDQ